MQRPILHGLRHPVTSTCELSSVGCYDLGEAKLRPLPGRSVYRTKHSKKRRKDSLSDYMGTIETCRSWIVAFWQGAKKRPTALLGIAWTRGDLPLDSVGCDVVPTSHHKVRRPRYLYVSPLSCRHKSIQKFGREKKLLKTMSHFIWSACKGKVGKPQQSVKERTGVSTK